MAAIPQDIARDVLARFVDHESWCPSHLTIRNKLGQEVPLHLSPAQAKLYAAAQEQEARGEPIRIVVLKPRQVHMSVGVASLIFRKVPFQRGQRAVTIAHRDDASEQVFGYYEQFYDSYQPSSDGDLRILRCERRSHSKGNYRMEFDGGGYIRTFTAGNNKIGRSASLRFLHLTEYAFWNDPGTVMTGLMNCVPDDPGTAIIIESTANGVGDSFHRYWQRTFDLDSAWKGVFFAWWEHPEYTREPTNTRQFQDSLSRDELALQQKYHLTFGQLNWRRWHIKNKCEGQEDRFRQEMPSCPEEAFLVSGRPRFSAQSLAMMPVVENPLAGRLERVTSGVSSRLQFLAQDRGELKIWKRPVQGRRYVIGADTAEGLDATDEAGEGDPDYCAAAVGDLHTGEQVATFRARVHPGVFGQYLHALGEYYNWAFLVPEVNNTGIATLWELEQLHYPLDRIYDRKRNPDDKKSGTPQELGWKTTTVTRPFLISTLDTAIRELSIIIRDPVTLAECYSFIINKKGKPEAQPGAHDDTVIAIALMVIGIVQAPRSFREFEDTTKAPGTERRKFSRALSYGPRG